MNHMWEEFYTIKLNQPTVSNFGSNAMNPMQPNKTLMWFLLLNFFIRRCDIQILIWFRAPPTVSFWLANSFYNSSISLVKREKLSLAAPSIYKRNSSTSIRTADFRSNGWLKGMPEVLYFGNRNGGGLKRGSETARPPHASPPPPPPPSPRRPPAPSPPPLAGAFSSSPEDPSDQAPRTLLPLPRSARLLRVLRHGGGFAGAAAAAERGGEGDRGAHGEGGADLPTASRSRPPLRPWDAAPRRRWLGPGQGKLAFHSCSSPLSIYKKLSL